MAVTRLGRLDEPSEPTETHDYELEEGGGKGWFLLWVGVAVVVIGFVAYCLAIGRIPFL